MLLVHLCGLTKTILAVLQLAKEWFVLYNCGAGIFYILHEVSLDEKEDPDT